MIIQRHRECVESIGAPSDMQDGSCGALPVIYVRDDNGVWANSFWKPDATELAALNAGGAVVLMVRAVGRQHPVVYLATTSDATEPA